MRGGSIGKSAIRAGVPTLEELLERRRLVGDLGSLEYLISRTKGDSGRKKVFVQADKKGKAKFHDVGVKNEVLRLHHGFIDTALSRLTEIAFGGDANSVKSNLARWELAKWFANFDEHEKLDYSLFCLDELLAISPAGLKMDRVRILAADVALSMGKVSAAARYLHGCSESADVALMRAKVASSPSWLTSDAAAQIRLRWINRIWKLDSLQTAELLAGKGVPLDRISITIPPVPVEDQPLVSVVIPNYCAARTLPTAVKSLLAQTWKNLEVIIVDDASDDDSVSVAKSLAEADARVRVVELSNNNGCYNARNVGLELAKGEYFTCHDSDDWSHPQKIERQVLSLIGNPGLIANTSMHCRVHEDLKPDRRGNGGFFVFPNMSSLMFRRKTVLSKVGYWDNVYFGGDGEFKKRLEQAFGVDAVEKLGGAPLSLVRTHDGSLTANKQFGYNGFKTGARLEHEEAAHAWRADKAARGEAPYMPRFRSERPYRIPAILDGIRERRKYDVVIMSDLRLPGGTTSSNVHEAIASHAAGCKTAFVHAGNYSNNPARPINPKIRKLINDGVADLVVFGEELETDLLIIRFPLILDPVTSCLPKISARSVRIIVNQPPQRTWGEPDLLYDIHRCHEAARNLFGVEPIWHPIGPTARQGFDAIGSGIELDPEDWVNLIDVDEWARSDYTPGADKVRIGRHSRDHWTKWPSTPEDLGSIYPINHPEIEVHVLGGIDSVQSLIGSVPENWKVWGFGQRDPKEFLAELDAFVYFTHPQYLEAFGRTIFEAMSVGVPVILPEQFRVTFGEVALYAHPSEVSAMVKELTADHSRYQEMVARGQEFVRANYGFQVHADRLKRIIGKGNSI